ncbi:MAG: DUF6090 family protein [Bacteroidota bacterium]
MINFFRKIRKKLAGENQFLKYSRYAIGEIVLVVIGILIALQINNWNQEDKNHQKEMFYLIGLKEGLQSSKVELARIIEKTKKTWLSSDSLILISRSYNTSIPDQALDSLIILSINYAIFTPDEGIITEIINSGDLEIIKDKSIRRYIASRDSHLNNIKKYEEFQKTISEKYIDYLTENIDFTNLEESNSITISETKDGFFSNLIFRNHLSGRSRSSRILNQLYINELKMIDSIEIIIDRELENKIQ